DFRDTRSGDVLFEPLSARSWHSCAHLYDARLGTEYCRWSRGPSRSWICRILCRRRLLVRSACAEFRVVVLDLSTARGHSCFLLGLAAWLSRSAVARRLSRNRYARLRRNHPPCHYQLAGSNERPEWNFGNPTAELFRHSV